MVSVSADRLSDQLTPEGYYLARVILSCEAVQTLDDLELHRCMRSEVMIVSGARTALSYFLKTGDGQLQRFVPRGIAEHGSAAVSTVGISFLRMFS